MELIYNNDEKELGKLAAGLVYSQIRELLEKKKYVVLGLPGGRSVAGTYRQFSLGNFGLWSRVHIFLADERMVGIGHADSNFKAIKESFAGELAGKKLLPEENLHPFLLKPGEKDNGLQEYSLTKYNRELKKYGSKFDIVLLGVGEDGHVAALFPGHASIKNESENFFSMDDAPKPPKERVTSPKKMLMKAECAVAFFIGEGKKEALKKYLSSSESMETCPAKLINNAKKSYVLTDIKI